MRGQVRQQAERPGHVAQNTIFWGNVLNLSRHRDWIANILRASSHLEERTGGGLDRKRRIVNEHVREYTAGEAAAVLDRAVHVVDARRHQVETESQLSGQCIMVGVEAALVALQTISNDDTFLVEIIE